MQTLKKKHPDIKPPPQIFPAQNILSQAKLSFKEDRASGPEANKKAPKMEIRSMTTLSLERDGEEKIPEIHGNATK